MWPEWIVSLQYNALFGANVMFKTGTGRKK